jgi:hypothetical protein
MTIARSLRWLPLLLLTPFVAGCFGDDDTIVEYRLRCTDDTASSLSCPEWKTVTPTYYRIDQKAQKVYRRVDNQAPKQYASCRVYNLENWSCGAEIGLPAIEFKQGRRLQDQDDTLSRRGIKRVTWFEWWSTRIMNDYLG